MPAEIPSLSPLAQRYRHFLQSALGQAFGLAEPELFPSMEPAVSELEWQSRWFAGDFGNQFTTTDGRAVEIVQLGWWNHGAGPDFRECAVKLDGEILRGSIELDPEVRDWENHGHSENPAYEDVILHVFLHRGEAECFTRTASHRLVPQVLLNPKLPHGASQMQQPAAKPGRCSLTLGTWSDGRITSLLEAAARYRLELKSARWQRVANVHGWDQAVFQGMAEALGYSQNKLPMTILSQRLTLAFLKRHPDEREAMFFGSAGFLDGFNFDQADTETKSYLRTLWEVWWKRRAETTTDAPRPNLKWIASGTRPMNHPQRRVAALSELAGCWKALRRQLQPADAFVEKDFRKFMESLTHPYWDHHYTLTSNPSPKRMALIGGSRITDILANLIYPMLIPERELLWKSYCNRTAPLENEKTKRAALRLFGEKVELADSFTTKIFHQQALLQIYQDFCLCDASDCLSCPFPEQLNQWK